MYKSVIGNPNYFISLNGHVINKDGRACTLPTNGNTVTIEIYGTLRTVDFDWLLAMSHFEVKLPEDLRRHLDHITFVDVDHAILRLNLKKQMVFTQPINVDKAFRLIPGFTKYMVSREGVVREAATHKQLKPWLPTNPKYYPAVSLYNPDKGWATSYKIHRLVALAWVFDENRHLSYMVNHIDGNKHNFSYRNLEWATPSENAIHAFENELRDDNVPCKIRDFDTHEVIEFSTMSDACRHMGVEPRYIENFDFQRPSKMIKDRYEIRFAGDSSEWFYTDSDKKAAGRYTVTVTQLGGEPVVYHDTRHLRKDLALWNVSNAIGSLVCKAKDIYPGIEVVVVDHYDTRPIQYINVQTLAVFETDTIMEIARRLGQSKGAIRNALMTSETQVLAGHAFRRKTDKPWDTNFVEYMSRSMCILATHSATAQTLEFKSLRDIAEHFKRDRSVFNVRMNTDKELDGWTFKEMK